MNPYLNSSVEDMEARCKLAGSLLYFTKAFYGFRTGRLFELSEPYGRESHYLTICRELVRVLNGETKRLIINVPPRYGKTELLIHFVAWTLAQFPDSNYIYVSYSHTLAKKQTQTIRDIITNPHYKQFFGITLKDDTTAKDNFETNFGGSVYAAGAGGSITGRGAGIKGADRFGGAIIIDDIHKPDEVTSDTIRCGINEWYYNTLQSRVNSSGTPIIFIGQRLHEDDLAANLLATGEWKTLVIPAIDLAGNALHPQMHTIQDLRKMQDLSPYEFSAQYQQNPQPAGGGIFKPEWFTLLEFEPEIYETFITCDTAETDKTYNDATVFSFWGVYRIKHDDIVTDMIGLHWIDCVELRVEPKDLKSEFMHFYRQCMMHRIKPKLAAIEKKSTGTTLVSVLQGMQGLQILNIERTRASGSKTQRFLEIQPWISAGHISLPSYGRHTKMCLEHMRKITANDSHRFDDICDTCCDAAKLAIIDKVIGRRLIHDDRRISQTVMSKFSQIQKAKDRIYGANR